MKWVKHILKPVLYHRSGRVGIIFIGILLFVAVFADLLSGDIPLYLKSSKGGKWPLIEYYSGSISHGSSFNYQWRNKYPDADDIIFPLNPFGPGEIDRSGMGYKRPGFIGEEKPYKHLLGTDRLGRDVLAGMIHGSRVAVIVSFLSVFLALIIGIVIGAMPGYYGDNKLRISIIQTIILGLFLVLLIYFLRFSQWNPLVVILLVLSICILFLWLVGKLERKIGMKSGWRVPLDMIIMRLVDVFRSIPGLFFLLTLLVVFNKPGIWSLVLVIAFLRWSLFTRYIRGEFLSLREAGFVKQGLIQGVSDFNLMFRRILPHAMTPIYVLVAFSMGSAVILESTLSFLGLGLDPDHMSWGMIMNGARQYITAWWMAVFPAVAILFTVMSFNAIARSMSAYFHQSISYTE